MTSSSSWGMELVRDLARVLHVPCHSDSLASMATACANLPLLGPVKPRHRAEIQELTTVTKAKHATLYDVVVASQVSGAARAACLFLLLRRS